jgi:hypothetical protein
MTMMKNNNPRWKYPISLELLGVAVVPFQESEIGHHFLQVMIQEGNTFLLPSLWGGHLLYMSSKYWSVRAPYREKHPDLFMDALQSSAKLDAAQT